MNFFHHYIGDLFAGKNFFRALMICILIFILSFFIKWLQVAALIATGLYVILVLADYAALFFNSGRIDIKRKLPARFSNGDENEIAWEIGNHFNFRLYMTLMDEWPVQFQQRNPVDAFMVPGGEEIVLSRTVKPIKRGDYQFGNVHLFIQSPLRMLERRISRDEETSIPCYPSFVRLYSYGWRSRIGEMQASNSSRTRRIGQSMEFEQIKDYISGDDIRNLNWKATARRGRLMINTFREERSQYIYSLLDKGRQMKMPFDGMSLLDYAINSTLMLSDVALRKGDKAGVITFSDKVHDVFPADNRPTQLGRILELLYQQQTGFPESDYEALYAAVRQKVRQRSLLVLYTNFDSLSSAGRNIEYLKLVSKFHLLLVCIFVNTQIQDITETPVHDMAGLYTKIAAQRLLSEKKRIRYELSRQGINSILATPQKLSLQSINKYLDMKMKRAL